MKGGFVRKVENPRKFRSQSYEFVPNYVNMQLKV